MTTVHFITHPEVVIDPALPVAHWPLSAVGARRMRLVAGRPRLAGVRSLFTSTERKATDAAGLLAERLGIGLVAIEGLGENDRSATGYLPKAECEAVADEFFARSEQSVRGWERAADAQHRIVGAVERAMVLAAAEGGIAIVSHGGVGALLLCHLQGVPISRDADQPGGRGGHVFSFDRASRRLLTGWQPIEA